MLGALVQSLLVLVIAGVVYWLSGFLPDSGPFKKIGQGLIVIAAVLIVIFIWLGIFGIHTGLPR